MRHAKHLASGWLGCLWNRGEAVVRGLCPRPSQNAIKPNSGLLKVLPRHPGAYIEEINMDYNYIGVTDPRALPRPWTLLVVPLPPVH
jgi:hypothetical protein